MKKHLPEHQPLKALLKRATMCLLCVCVAVLATLLYTESRDKTIDTFENPYPLIDPARSIIDQAHFLSTIEPLRQSLFNVVDEYEKQGLRIGVYFEYLNTGANISINQEERFWPASLSKMPTALVVMKKIEQGDWKLENELVLFPEDRNDAFGTLWQRPAGTRLTIEELLQELLINSDDTANRIFVRNLDSGEFEHLLFALGMQEMYDNNYNITAKEYSRIFRALYTSSYLKREHSAFLLSLLSETSFNEFLDTGIPEGIVFAHKIGEHDGAVTYLDSGIVYVPDRPFLLTVMVDAKNGGGRDVAKRAMADIANYSFDYVSTAKKNN